MKEYVNKRYKCKYDELGEFFNENFNVSNLKSKKMTTNMRKKYHLEFNTLMSLLECIEFDLKLQVNDKYRIN